MAPSARAEIAAVLASHGDRAGSDPNRILLFHADAVRNLTGLSIVAAGVLKGEPALEEALEFARRSGANEIVVYPLFMAGGYFTGKVLPERIRVAGLEPQCRILQPLGLDPGLADVLRHDALEAARLAGFEPEASRLLIVGHGSKYGPASAEATRDVAGKLAAAGGFRVVETAFLEEAPLLSDALRSDRSPAVVSGFFFGDGMHAGEDVPAAIRETNANAVYAGPLGRSVGVSRLIAAALKAEIAARSH
jgi:sirohydrochlorin ferrochelatase